MRLGKKKEKTGEAEVGRAQTVDGVARLICSAKSSHNVPLKGKPYCYDVMVHFQYTCMYSALLIVVCIFVRSIHRRHGAERREVLPAVDPVADARQDLPRGHVRGPARAAGVVGARGPFPRYYSAGPSGPWASQPV